jgi:hypothetical protein
MESQMFIKNLHDGERAASLPLDLATYATQEFNLYTSTDLGVITLMDVLSWSNYKRIDCSYMGRQNRHITLERPYGGTRRSWQQRFWHEHPFSKKKKKHRTLLNLGAHLRTRDSILAARVISGTFSNSFKKNQRVQNKALGISPVIE